jgi:DNA-binding response OmpR family regulator
MSQILIVADDKDTVTSSLRILKTAGYAVKLLRTSSDLFRLLPQFGPDIVVTDMNFPGIAGMLTYSFTRRLSELKQTKIIVITNRPYVVDLAKGVWGAELVLSKPMLEDELLASVAIYFEGQPLPW